MQQKGTTVLHLATKYSEGSIVSALLTAKANVNAARAVWRTIESINLSNWPIAAPNKYAL
jgi:ankyrin repeat protein